MSNLAIDYMHTKRFCLPKSMAGCAKMHVGQVERAVIQRSCRTIDWVKCCVAD
jgi:hypothetical protein